MHLHVQGLDNDGKPLSLAVQLTVTNDKGPEGPSCVAVVLATKSLKAMC